MLQAFGCNYEGSEHLKLQRPSERFFFGKIDQRNFFLFNQLSIRVSVSGKAFYGIMLLRSRLHTKYTNEFNKSSNSYYIPECCLLLYTHCFHKTILGRFGPNIVSISSVAQIWWKITSSDVKVIWDDTNKTLDDLNRYK